MDERVAQGHQEQFLGTLVDEIHGEVVAIKLTASILANLALHFSHKRHLTTKLEIDLRKEHSRPEWIQDAAASNDHCSEDFVACSKEVNSPLTFHKPVIPFHRSSAQ